MRSKTRTTCSARSPAEASVPSARCAYCASELRATWSSRSPNAGVMTTDLDGAFAVVAERVRASTVRVHDVRGRGSGSGIGWAGKGLVITNAPVVRGPYALVETHAAWGFG